MSFYQLPAPAGNRAALSRPADRREHSALVARPARPVLGILALAATAFLTGSAPAGPPLPDLSPANEFVLLALGGTFNDFGAFEINSSTSIVGDVGYGAYTDSTTNQKIDTFNGRAWVHSTANFSYTVATYQPSLGIAFGTGAPGDPVDGKLAAATTAALAAGTAFANLVPTHNLGAISGSTTVNSTGDVNVISATSVSFNSNTLTLKSRPGFTDTFVFNISGDFDFSQSAIALQGTTASNVLFNFTGATSRVTVNKASSAFTGTILAPLLGQSVIYHNPASFNGSILAYNITVHSDFNINLFPFIPIIPTPGSAAMLATVGLMMIRSRRR